MPSADIRLISFEVQRSATFVEQFLVANGIQTSMFVAYVNAKKMHFVLRYSRWSIEWANSQSTWDQGKKDLNTDNCTDQQNSLAVADKTTQQDSDRN